jgi:hypothetical protein
MPAGAPRTTSPPKEEVIKLGIALVKWATEKTPEDEPLRSRFCEWYTLEEIGMIRRDWEALIRLEEFRMYYERAQAALGRRLIDGTVNPSIGHRFMWHYVPEAKEQEIEKMTIQAEITAKLDAKPDTKFVFEVNYKNDGASTVEVSPQTIPGNGAIETQ